MLLAVPYFVPLLIGQGLGDELVLLAAQQAYVTARCAAGGQVDYRTYDGFDHVSVVGAESLLVPELLAWTKDRFAGQPANSTCYVRTEHRCASCMRAAARRGQQGDNGDTMDWRRRGTDRVGTLRESPLLRGNARY
jgi:Secretory lipase